MKTLATHEINVHYRTADNEEWLKNPSIIGFEVRKSHCHQTADICDDMAGLYPKEFLFTGWHLHCICYMIPILATKEERSAVIDALLRGDDPSTVKINYIKNIPDRASKYIKENADRITALEETPKWVMDNFKEGNVLKGFHWRIPMTNIKNPFWKRLFPPSVK